MIKKILILLIISIIILAIVCIFLHKLYQYNVLKDDSNQVDILCEIISNICDENENIYLNNSALINFITGKEYSDKSKLLEFQNKNENGEKYVISINYNKNEKILTVTKKNESNTYSYSQRYKLSVNLNKIEYTTFNSPVETVVYK